MALEHQVAIYTHSDTDHIHNHIVINAVNLETGKKFNNNKQALRDLSKANDEVFKPWFIHSRTDIRMRYTKLNKT